MTDATGANAAFDLRSDVFRNGRPDRDRFDATAGHLLIEGGDGLAGCARLTVQEAAGILTGYTAQHYDLRAFAKVFPKAVEVGRICLRPGLRDPEVPRLMLAVLARQVEAAGAMTLYGCSSFPMAAGASARLRDRVAPADWMPGRKAPETQPLIGTAEALPPLLRSYLSLGARVSDHAVVDRELGTVHVFTALPIAAIPPRRAQLLSGLLDAV
ncbi:GNAT family N-acetyltransferase [Jannaschia sp. 2305UL9-9]|uniref:GNAT family N-acetyltransferase n=1 Tax=Jannaschia sp. 2305UL9-9 TaxID=3121638 RepID=UPI0035295FE5